MSQPKQDYMSPHTHIGFQASGVGDEYRQGDMLGGRYQVVSTLGRGGMGVVYRVKQVFLDKEFALKTISKQCLTETSIRRFQQEALTSFAIDHANVIMVNDFGLLDDDTPFLVMELLDGETLGDRLRLRTRLSVDEATDLFIQVCFGMAYAHEKGIVHRDIKPNNIMILQDRPPGTEGSVKIVDFGIAKYSAREGGEVQALTRTGEIFGSPLYMSPEQCQGGSVDHRSDIYSLGCVIFETLTGSPPFVGENALITMMMHQTETAPSLSDAAGKDFPKQLEAIVAKMIAKQPHQRYQSLGEVALELGALKNGGTVKAARTQEKAKREQEKISIAKPTFIALLFLAVAISALISYFAVYALTPVAPRKVIQVRESAITQSENSPAKNAAEEQPRQE
ncbi:MAG: serine/threonine-protein kinase [Candidatus Obscuribacterales bacterium]|nr:serine/threonine protein kinase [Cyanobacteria bacterium SZAS LIN-5]